MIEVYYIFCVASHCRRESDTTMTADATFFLLQSASCETEAYCVSMAHSHADVAVTTSKRTQDNAARPSTHRVTVDDKPESEHMNGSGPCS